MRVRLQIHRHALPETRLLWQAKPSHTVAQFLQSLNVQYPLETAQWGLEDYVVSIADYEALHYHRIGDVFQPDDQICIRPLETNEVKQRRLLGREQIAANGMHLFDGLPFGRHNNTALTLTRPPIRIPPRNLNGVELDEEQFLDSLENGAEEEELSEDEEPLTITMGGEADEDDDDDDDESYHDYSDVDMSDDTNKAETDARRSVEQLTPEACAPAQNDNNEDVTAWNGFSTASEAEPAKELSKNIEANSHVSASSSSASSSSSSSSESGEETNGAAQSSASSDSESTSTDDSDSDGEPEVVSSKAPTAAQIPFNGKKQTQDRNKRRVIHKKMLWLKKQGLISEDASHEDVKIWMERNEAPNGGRKALPSATADQKSPVLGQGMGSDKQAAPTDTANKAKSTPNADQQSEDLAATLAQRRKELLAQIENGGIDVTATPGTSAGQDVEPAGASQSSTPPAKRARLDVTSSHRLLLGALGVKVPKTAADRQKAQDKLAQQTQRKPVERPTPQQTVETNEKADTAEVEVDVNDPEFWRSKIRLSAVECCADARVQTLSEPPFPFYQRWDPSLTKGKKRKRKQGDTVNGNKRMHLNQDATYAYPDDDGLDYGEEDWTEQYDADQSYDEVYTLAAAESSAPDTASEQVMYGQHRNNDEDETESIPELPDNHSQLPLITSFSDLKSGDLITYSVLELTNTSWTPELSPLRTGEVCSLRDFDREGEVPFLTIIVAKRDIPKPQYDADGNRIYGKFEAPDSDEDDDDDDEEERPGLEVRYRKRIATYDFDELVQPRLIMRWDELDAWKKEHVLPVQHVDMR